MKLGLSLLAIGATAVHISDGDDCFSEWKEDYCTKWSYRDDYCRKEQGSCGWWFSTWFITEDDDQWVSCTEWSILCE